MGLPIEPGEPTALLDPTLVLNRSWCAVHVTTVRRALGMLCRGSVAVLDPESLTPLGADAWLDRPVADGARAVVAEARVARERLVVRAPIAGTILKLETRVGEYKAAGPNAGALLRMGDISTLHVRTDIDELDAWRFDPAGEAVARIRGGSRLEVPLRFVRIVPDVAPKRTLTGENAERIHTRVLQVIYALENPPEFIRPGMLVDVAAEAKPAAAAGR